MNIVYIVNNNPLYIDMLLKSIESISYFNSNVNFYVKIRVISSEVY